MNFPTTFFSIHILMHSILITHTFACENETRDLMTPEVSEKNIP